MHSKRKVKNAHICLQRLVRHFVGLWSNKFHFGITLTHFKSRKWDVCMCVCVLQIQLTIYNYIDLCLLWQDTHTNDFSKWPNWRTILLFYNRFIKVLYMFRAKSCSSSGGKILLIKHLVSSISVSGRPNPCTGRPLIESDHTRCCINTIWPPDDEHDFARNM